MAEFGKNDIAVIDMTNDEETLKGIIALGKSMTGLQMKTAARVGANGYILSVGIARLGLTSSECESEGVAPGGSASRYKTVGQVLAYAARGTEDSVDADMEAMVNRVKRYHGLQVDAGVKSPGFLAICQGLNSTDGDEKVKAVKDAFMVFGGAATFYSIAKGKKLHDSEIVEATPEDDGGADDEPTPGDAEAFILSQLMMIRQYAEKHGVAVGTVSHLFGQVFK